MNMFKGMAINVSLSDEQMEYIANLSADKVNQTRTHYMNETERLQEEVQDLRKEIKRREDILIEDLLRDNNYKKLYERMMKNNKALREEIENLKDLDKNKRKLEKLRIDLEQTKFIGNQDTVLVDYVLSCISSDDY